LSALKLLGQANKDKVRYEAEYIYRQSLEIFDMGRIPEGCNVVILYDLFFKTYRIAYDNKSDKRVHLDIDHLSDSSYVSVPVSNGVRVYRVSYNLDSDGILILDYKEKSEGLNMVTEERYIIEGAIKTK